MRVTPPFAVLIPLLALLASCANSIHVIRSQAELDKLMSKKGSLMVVGMFDKKDRPLSKGIMSNLIGGLADDPEILKHGFAFYLMDFGSILGKKEVLEATSHTALLYFIGQHEHEFQKFNEYSNMVLTGKMTEGEMLGHSRAWLASKTKKLKKRLASEREIEAKLAKYKRILVFLGHKKSRSEELIYKLLWDHPRLPLYRIHDRELAQRVYKNTTQEELGDREMLCIFRDWSFLHTHEPNPADCMKASKKYEKYENFVHIHKHDKLLVNHHHEQLVSRVFGRIDRMLYYLYNNTSDPAQLAEFERAVTRLPKHFVYAAINLDGELDKFELDFAFSGLLDQQEPGRVYTLDRYSGLPKTTVMEGPVTFRNVLNFFHRFYQSNRHYYKKQQVRGIDEHINAIREHLDEL